MAYGDIGDLPSLDWTGTHYAQRELPVVQYSGPPASIPDESIEDYARRAGLTIQWNDEGSPTIYGSDGERMGPGAWGGLQEQFYASKYAEKNLDSYDAARRQYSLGYQPWNWQNVNEGLSNRTPYNLNALYGGSQYQSGRVSDWSHLDSTQYDATRLAANTRNYLWNVYNDLKSQGIQPSQNPDEVALDVYQKYTGGSSPYGYGPNSNPLMIRELLLGSFLNKPEVASITRGYQTSPDKMPIIQEYQKARDSSVPVWQTFEQQGQGGFDFGSLIPAVIGAMAFPALAPALGGLGAGALVGGLTSAAYGNDPLKGAVFGSITGGLSDINPEVIQGIQNTFNVPLDTAKTIASTLSGTVAPALATGNVENVLTGAVTGGLSQSVPVNDAVASVKDVLMSSGITDPALASKLASTLVSTAGSTAMTGLTGGDMTSALVSGALKLVPAALSGVKDSFTLRADSGDIEPSSMDVSVTPEAAFSPIGSTSSPQAEWTSGYDLEPIRQVMAPDYGEYIPGGFETTEQVAAANPDLYPGGVLPAEGMMTVFYPSGSASNIPQTPVDVAKNAVKFGISGAGGSAPTQAGVAAPGAGYIQSALDQLSRQGKYDDPSKRSYLSPAMISTGSPLQSMPMFQGIDPKLARVLSTRTLAGGGTVDGPVDYVPGPEDRYYARHAKRGFAVRGPGTGQSDDIPTMLAEGEFVIDSDTVSALGDGSNKAGAELLDAFRESVREHKRSAPKDKIPPKASPLQYMKLAMKKTGR